MFRKQIQVTQRGWQEIKRPDTVCSQMQTATSSAKAESIHELQNIWVQTGKRGRAMMQHTFAAYMDRHIVRDDSYDGR